jgi:methylglutaconyl-CoA hydratase
VQLERLELHFDGPVARIWLNRPDARNAFDGLMVTELRKTLFDLRTVDAVRVVVLGGRGPSFCAGADIAVMKASAAASHQENLVDAKRFAAMFAAVGDFPKPIVGRIHGGVYGGGVGFCCGCDIVVASDDAKFALTEVRLGIIPGVISPYVLRRLGDRAARELMLTGERFDAAAALHYGVVNYVVPAAGLDAKVAERVGELLKGAPKAQARIKELLIRWTEIGWDEYRATLPETLAHVRSGDEAKDGFAAFFEKRKPRWVD